jgi:hypothetical protein
MSLKLGAWLLLGVSLVRCMPDFDSLSSGAGAAGGVVGQPSGGRATNAGGSSGSAGDAGNFGGDTSGGVATSTGGSSAGSAGDSDRGGSTNQGGQTQNAAGTAEPVGGAFGAGATGEGAAAGDAASASGGEGASGGEEASGGQGPTTGGEGGTPSEPCEFLHPGATEYNGFDGGLDGTGFTSATTTTALVTTLGTTATSHWDAMVGRSCPGSLHMEAQFKGYASGTASDERAIVDLHFSQADWTGAVELRAWIKVEPAAAPLASVQFFVLSGNAFLYDSAYDNVRFRSGQWTEMVLPLTLETNFDPSRVLRIGVELSLQRQGEGTNPPLSAPIDVWIDDVWVR